MMLQTIMEGGGANNEDFKHPLRSIKMKLNKALLSIRHKSYEKKQKKLVEDKLDVRSILELAKDEYHWLLDDGKWPAATHNRDSKAINRNYGSVNVADASTSRIKKIVNTLIQGSSNRDKSKDKCNNCGAIGHWA